MRISGILLNLSYTRKIVGLISAMCVICVPASVYAAGYTCPTYKKYTSCNSGFYLNGTSAGNACVACSTVSFTDSGTDTGTDSSGCTATSQTVTVNISNGSYKQNQTRSGSRSWSRAKSRTCYRTGGAGGTNGASACTGSGNCGGYTYGNYSYGTCSYTTWTNSGGGHSYSCNAGYYLSNGQCLACGGNGYYCPGDNTRKSVTAGYYSTGGDANTRTGQSQCTSPSYCTGGVKYSCPPPNNDKVHTYNGPNILRAPTGATAATQCYLDNSLADTWTFEYQYHGFWRSDGKCYYSASTNIYNNCEYPKRFTECNAGYFIDNSIPMASDFSNTCTPCSAGTYTTAVGNIGSDVADGSYTYATSCTACGAGTYQDASAATSCKNCPNGYTDNKTTGQSKIEGCQIAVAGGKYLTTKNTTTTASCSAGTARGAHNVAYGSTSSCDKCGAGTYAPAAAASCTACSGAAEYQPNAGASSCIGIPHGYVKASNSTVTPITITCPAGQFMWHWSSANGKTTCEACHAGYYCPGGTNIYGSGSVGSPNSAGVVTIYGCPSPYTAGGKGLSAQSQCKKTCGNSGVSNGYIPANAGAVTYPSDCAYNAANTVCNSGFNLTSSYVCAAMCAAGVTKIRTGSVTVPLYAAKQTTPALHVNVGGQACYGNLGSGKATSSINVSYGGNTYHSIR